MMLIWRPRSFGCVPVTASSGTLDERYLTWIHRQLEPDTQRNPARSHWLLLKQLNAKEFTWFIANDDNRLYDGLDIRQEFIDAEEGGDVDGIWLSEACSFLEMLVALCHRISFETEQEVDYWFWQILDNLKLRKFVDGVMDEQSAQIVDDILDDVIQRNIEPNGERGMFPLKHAVRDQRQVEIWYQMSQYIMENVSI